MRALARAGAPVGLAFALAACGDDAPDRLPPDEPVDEAPIDAFIDPGVPFFERPAGTAPLASACARAPASTCPGLLGRWTALAPRASDWDVHVAFSGGRLWSAARAGSTEVVVVEDVGGAEREHRLTVPPLIVTLRLVGRDVGGPLVAVLTGEPRGPPTRVVAWRPLEDPAAAPVIDAAWTEPGEGPWALRASFGPDGEPWVAVRPFEGPGRIVRAQGPNLALPSGDRCLDGVALHARCDTPLWLDGRVDEASRSCALDLFGFRDGAWLATNAPRSGGPADIAVSPAGTVAVVEAPHNEVRVSVRPLGGRWRRLPSIPGSPHSQVEQPFGRFVDEALHVAFWGRTSGIDGDREAIFHWIFEDERWRPALGTGPDGVVVEAFDLASFDVDACGRAAAVAVRVDGAPDDLRRTVEIHVLD